MRHRVGVERVKIQKVRGINSLLRILPIFFSFYLTSALVKAGREVLLRSTSLTYISWLHRKDVL